MEGTMGPDRYYFYLSSQDSKDRHPQNTVADFIVELNTPIELKGKWQVGLVESDAKLTQSRTNAFLCCNLCSESQVRGRNLPVLKKVTTKGNYYTPLPLYVDTNRTHVQRIHIYSLDSDLNPLKTISTATFDCMVELKRVYKE